MTRRRSVVALIERCLTGAGARRRERGGGDPRRRSSSARRASSAACASSTPPRATACASATASSTSGRAASPARSRRAASRRASASRSCSRPGPRSTTRSSARCSPVCVPVPLYPPVRLGRLDEYHERTPAMLRACGARLVLTRPAHPPAARPLVVAALGGGLGCEVVDALERRAPLPVAVSPDDARLRAVLLGHHRGAEAGAAHPPPGARQRRGDPRGDPRRLARGAGARRTSGVSWLPLYHDMGLVGAVLVALSQPGELVLIPPELFIARPAVWLRAISRYGATTSPAPNFAYALCADRVRDEELAGVDLSSWRIALNGAEPVTPGVLERFVERFAPFGLRPEALTPVYGLAEATPRRHLQRAARAVPPRALRSRRAGAGGPRAPRRGRPAARERRPPARRASRSASSTTDGDALADGPPRARPRARALDDAAATSACPRRPPRRCATAGSTPATPASSTTASSTSTAARRTCSCCAGATTRRRTSSTRSTTSPACAPAAAPPSGSCSERGEGEELVLLRRARARSRDVDDASLAERRAPARPRAHRASRPRAVHVLAAGTLPRTSSGKIRRAETAPSLPRGRASPAAPGPPPARCSARCCARSAPSRGSARARRPRRRRRRAGRARDRHPRAAARPLGRRARGAPAAARQGVRRGAHARGRRRARGAWACGSEGGAGQPFVGIRYVDGDVVAEGRFAARRGPRRAPHRALECAPRPGATSSAPTLRFDGASMLRVSQRASARPASTTTAGPLEAGPPRRRRRPAQPRPPRGGPRGRARRGRPRATGCAGTSRLPPWTDLVEVHWADGVEAYVTPVARDEVGVALLWRGGSAALRGPAGALPGARSAPRGRRRCGAPCAAPGASTSACAGALRPASRSSATPPATSTRSPARASRSASAAPDALADIVAAGAPLADYERAYRAPQRDALPHDAAAPARRRAPAAPPPRDPHARAAARPLRPLPRRSRPGRRRCAPSASAGRSASPAASSADQGAASVPSASSVTSTKRSTRRTKVL